MTHKDHERLHKVRYHWQKEQQLIREKYKIPYNMTYISQRCITAPASIASQSECLFRNKQPPNDLRRRTCRSDEYHLNNKTNDPNIPPMYCSKCNINIIECSCPNGLGQRWIHLQRKSHSTEKLSKKSSMNSIHDRHVSFDFSLTDRTNTQKAKSNQLNNNNKQLFVLLDWNNRQSLLTFIRTIKLNENLSNMTIEQLHELLTNNENIHIFNSIIDLILSMNDEQRRSFHCHIYIDPSYYSTIPDTIPLFQSRLIADNINLTQVLYSTQTIATLLGVKSIDKFSQEDIPTKKRLIEKRRSILHKQSLFIGSKIPYHTFRNNSVHTD